MSVKRMQEQLVLLREVIENSPYLSRDSRAELEKEIAEITVQLEADRANSTVWERKILAVNAKIANDEMDAVMTKIHHLNPSSPRLSEIRAVAHRLGGGEISPEQSRLELEQIMQH